MDEAFDILGFSHTEKFDVYRVSALCMQLSRMEFQGMGEVASPKNIDAGPAINGICNFGDNDELIYDCLINPKCKVRAGQSWNLTSAMLPRSARSGFVRHRTSWLSLLLLDPSSRMSMVVFSASLWTCVTPLLSIPP